MGSIFLNYRREDEPFCAGRLYDWLTRDFSPDDVFMDVDSIEPGRDFVRELEARVAQCDVLAVIGRHWLDAKDETGHRRLDDENDFVRIEIASALKQNKRVVPVLAGSAGFVRADTLPLDLKPLARRNGVRLTHERFRSDVQSLVNAIRAAMKEAGAARFEEAKAAVAESSPTSEASRYRRAFLCYAAQDRVEVLRRVNALKLAGIEIESDMLTVDHIAALDEGEKWDAKLAERIATCDLFLLFWSQAAARSVWVRREIDAALARQRQSADGAPDIIPVVLELPAPAVPDDLKHLHFDNQFAYLAEAAKAAKAADAHK